jgi:glycosyltransferase involved in cell wall biosynthesis
MSKPFLLYQAPVATRSGYGDHARDLLKSFKDLNYYDIKIVSTRWGSTPMDQLNPNDEFHKWVLDNIVTQITQQPDVYVQMTVPNEFQTIGKFNIGVTAGIETTIIPKDWVDGCNRMDLVITTSNHSKSGIEGTAWTERNKDTQQVIAEHRVSKPVEVLFEGTDYIKTDGLSKLDKIEEDFCFLFVGHWLQGNLYHDRKDVGGMIQTFLSAFSRAKGKKPALILKTSSANFSIRDREEILKKVNDVASKVNSDLSIYLLHGDLSPEDMWKLYNHPKVKASISFTHGEGFGRPLLEFSLTGKPIIASNWSGHVDFLTNEGSVLLKGDLKPVDPSAANQFLLSDSQWFYVNYSDAALKLIDVHNNYDRYLSASTKLGNENTIKFSHDKMTEALKNICDRYIKVVKHVDLVLPEF